MNSPVKQNPEPSFSIYEPGTTNKVPTLLHCFIQEAEIDVAKHLPYFILAKDGLVYQAVYDSKLPYQTEGKIRVIISFQKHSYGRFAVIRLKRGSQEHL